MGMGAETLYAPVSQLCEWVDAARPGDVAIYARGPALDPQHETAALVRRLAGEAKVTPFKTRDGGGMLIHQVKRQAAGSAKARRLHPDAARMLSVLADAAARGRPCPSNAEIAELLDFETREQARYRFNALVRAGHVRLIAREHFGVRVIEIAASGLRTATREGSA